MTFPTIPTGGRVVTGVQADTAPTRTFPNLSGLTNNSGDLMIAIISVYQSSVTNSAFSSWGGSFTEFVDQGLSSTMAIGAAYKWSTGSETGAITVTQAATITGHAAMMIVSIPGAHASTPPEATAIATQSVSAANMATLTPSWGAEDTLWIPVFGSGETGTTGTFDAPTLGATLTSEGYSDFVATTLSADAVGGVYGGLAFRQLNATSINPGSDAGGFGVDLTNARNAALTIAVRPSSAPPAVPPLAMVTVSWMPSRARRF